jgi:hypothetical protein
MNAINTDFLNISGGLIILIAGLVAVLCSLSRIKNREFTLLNFGFFFSLYGIRWLVEVPCISNAIGLPLTMPYLHSFLTYLIPIPLAAFLLNVLGRGLFNSMLWFFISTIVYAIAAMIYDLFSTGGALNPSINIVVVAVWCLIGGTNVILIKERQKTELKVLKITLSFLFLCLTNDNLVSMHALPWNIRLEHIDILVLFAGMGYIAIRRFLSSRKSFL